ncbi:MAG TPA: ATP-dependent RecD-like DNA helicase, partial [Lactococcus sp.]|nr:ATP-dependent RecD-like DNA helicase [Lactococcus sp.]
VANLVTQVATAWKKRGNNPFELQVLAPMYKGMAGINTLNALLQELFNPLEGRQEFNYQDVHFRQADKVLHLVNDAECNVFNGDLGVIVKLVPAKHTESKQDEIVMDFDGQEVTYPRAEWYKITLAYAMSIHKSQGSEFSTVVVPMVSSYSRMLERNLLYTAITRAKQSLILIGEQRAFAQAVQKESANRKTYLIERFSGKSEVLDKQPKPQMELVTAEKKESSTVEEISLFSEEDISENLVKEPFLTTALIASGDFDPLIGLTEEDFLIFK